MRHGTICAKKRNYLIALQLLAQADLPSRINAVHLEN